MRNYRKMIVWGTMLAGFLAGILFVNLSANSYLEKNSFWIQRLMESVQKKEWKMNSYLYFLIKRRGMLYILLAVLGQALGGQIWLVIYGAWFCFAEGIFLTSSYVQYSITGIWAAIFVQMPYMLCYGIVYISLVKKYVVQIGKREKYGYLKDWILYLPVMAVGMISECYTTPWFIGIILKWFA